MLVRPKHHQRNRRLAFQACAVTALTAVEQQSKLNKTRGLGSKIIKRHRRSVDVIFSELGRKNVRKAYRMEENSFWYLHKMLFQSDSIRKRNRGATINGAILNSARLSMALRWIAGGDKFDIAGNHGIGINEVMESVWLLVDVVNANENLKINLPTSYADQQEIADGFMMKSSPQFNNCVGCIDGMLIWMDKPSEKSKCGAADGSGKFFCGRKKIWFAFTGFL